MRLSELIGKEVVNLYDGTRLGVLGEADLLFDGETGDMEAIILPSRGGIAGIFGDRGHIVIPWNCVRKVGTEVIIVDLDQTYVRRHYPF